MICRTTAAALALVLSGTPAVAAACAAMCLGEVAPATAASTARPGHHAHAEAVTSTAALEAEHVHHVALAGGTSAPAAADVTSSAHDCCDSVSRPPVAQAAAARADTGLLVMAAMVAQPISPLRRPLEPAAPPDPARTALFPSPARPPLVLRI